jgi:hypothetical protein
MTSSVELPGEYTNAIDGGIAELFAFRGVQPHLAFVDCFEIF